MYDHYATSSRDLAEAVVERIWCAVMGQLDAAYRMNMSESGEAGFLWNDLVECVEETLVDGVNERRFSLSSTGALMKVMLLKNPHLYDPHILDGFQPLNREIQRPPALFALRKQNQMWRERDIQARERRAL